MEYKNFDEFKTEQPNILGYKDFGDYELEEDYECEYRIFRLYPDHTFIIVLHSGKCYLYKKDEDRRKFWDIDTVAKDTNIKNIKKYSILKTTVGRQIKEQYEKKSGLIVNDVIQYKEGEDINSKVRKEWAPLMST